MRLRETKPMLPSNAQRKAAAMLSFHKAVKGLQITAFAVNLSFGYDEQVIKLTQGSKTRYISLVHWEDDPIFKAVINGKTVVSTVSTSPQDLIALIASLF